MKISLGFLGALTLIFVVAKLWGIVDWSWWLVFLPVIISFGLVLSILLVILLVIILAAIFN